MSEMKEALSSKFMWALAGKVLSAGHELVRIASLELKKLSNYERGLSPSDLDWFFFQPARRTSFYEPPCFASNFSITAVS